METVLISVNKFINIDKERKNYVDSFEVLRNKIFELLKKDTPFSNLFNGLQLGGSYGDNLKVNKPDEFDLVFHLKLPENKILKVKEDPKIPGNVILNLEDILEKIKNQQQHAITYEHLKKWVTPNNELLVDNLQRWLETCFRKVLAQLENRIIVGGKSSSLKYKRCGPAHTIFVTGEIKYSVDFVPGILLEETHRIRKNHKGTWEAIPKPLKPQLPNNISFRASFYTLENEIIKDNRNLKNALRIMKKFRDSHQNMNNLKSYYIKTLFLWKASECQADYWKNPLSVVVVEMFKDLEKSLCEKQLKFYWNKQLNMYESLNNNQVAEMYNCVKSAMVIITKASQDLTPIIRYKVYGIFLNKSEMDSIGVSNLVSSKAYLHMNNTNNQNPVIKDENKSKVESNVTSTPTYIKAGSTTNKADKNNPTKKCCSCQKSVKPVMVSVGTNTDLNNDAAKCKVS